MPVITKVIQILRDDLIVLAKSVKHRVEVKL